MERNSDTLVVMDYIKGLYIYVNLLYLFVVKINVANNYWDPQCCVISVDLLLSPYFKPTRMWLFHTHIPSSCSYIHLSSLDTQVFTCYFLLHFQVMHRVTHKVTQLEIVSFVYVQKLDQAQGLLKQGFVVRRHTNSLFLSWSHSTTLSIRHP